MDLQAIEKSWPDDAKGQKSRRQWSNPVQERSALLVLESCTGR